MFLDELPRWFGSTLCVGLGLCFGSFLNVVIYRLPRDLSLVSPGSACPGCDKAIAGYDNIPLLSWLLLRGKARCCGTRISPRYPLIELLGGLLAWTIFDVRLLPFADQITLGEGLFLFSVYLTLSLGLLAAAAIDLEHMILPDSLTLGGAALGLVTSPFRPEVDPPMALLGAAVGYVGIWFPFIWLHTKLRGFPGMGLGDAKLMMLAGAWFGPLGALLILFAGALQGSVVAGIALLVRGKIDEPEAVAEQRRELLLAISEASGEEKRLLEEELQNDPLGQSPEEAPGGPRIAFGPFLALASIELLIFFDVALNITRAYLFL